MLYVRKELNKLCPLGYYHCPIFSAIQIVYEGGRPKRLLIFRLFQKRGRRVFFCFHFLLALCHNILSWYPWTIIRWLLSKHLHLFFSWDRFRENGRCQVLKSLSNFDVKNQKFRWRFDSSGDRHDLRRLLLPPRRAGVRAHSADRVPRQMQNPKIFQKIERREISQAKFVHCEQVRKEDFRENVKHQHSWVWAFWIGITKQ